MARPFRTRGAWALALVLAAGCQSYNFNPVGHCLIQPGTKRVTLSGVSSADVLFVVDESGSMAGEQEKLASNFSSFIGNLDATNAARAAAGLQPFDFHIAVTTTSVFWNPQTTNTCSSTCSGAAGQLVCCKTDGTPARRPKACTPGVTACPTTSPASTCGTGCDGFKGEYYCCDQATGIFPQGSIADAIPCSREGTACGALQTHYATCDAGDPRQEWPFPRGDFVSGAGGSAPRVLHFDKEVYTGTVNRQGFTRAQLVDFFAGPGAAVGNVEVGTCGSGQEQALAAARLAIEKALAGQQRDTYARTGAGTPPAPVATWDAATRTASSAADWLPPGRTSKLVLVFVGDEDDCSSPQDPSGGVVMLAEATGDDACTRDATTPAPLGQKQIAVQSFADFFMGLGRPVGAAFIFPAAQESCSGDTCTAGPGLCCARDCPGTIGVCTNNATCGGQAEGERLLSAATELRSRGADVVVGSICDPSFGTLLDEIAEIVKPPSGLTLPTLPAASDVALLRIADASGQTRKLCGRPLQGSFTLQEAQATGADWWFADSGNPGPPAAGITQFVYINPDGGCIANPGETYSADYLGRVPTGGCWNDTASPTSGDAMCQRTLGGAAGSWTCYAGVDGAGACAAPTASSPGTCICGARADNCAP
jgi:hypothetical protein